MNKIVIAIDGYSACGKSSTAKLVAAALNYTYIDSGAMYRAVTHYFLMNNIDLTNQSQIIHALDNIDIRFGVNHVDNSAATYLNGDNVEQKIRQMSISNRVSEVSSIKEVREAMVSQQQSLGKEKGVVMDGRDIGTIVFPNAELKVFMTADVTVRAERRQDELHAKGEQVDLNEIVENLVSRDHQDTTRKESPLAKASDARELDTTHLTLEEQVDVVVGWAKAQIAV